MAQCHPPAVTNGPVGTPARRRTIDGHGSPDEPDVGAGRGDMPLPHREPWPAGRGRERHLRLPPGVSGAWVSTACRRTRRANGANHNQALRALGNRLVGVLHGCLRYRPNYSEVTAWGESALPLDIWSRGMSNSGRPSVASWAWRQRALQTEAWVWAINVVVAPINDRRHTLAGGN
jgi:hypothetical protein